MNRQEKPWYRMMRWGDFIIAIIMVALALGLWGLAARQSAQSAAAVVLLRDGQLVRAWSATELAAGGEQAFSSHGLHYTFEWRDGRIRFAKADCPDQVCVLSGWVGRRGSIAACVPGGLVLKAADNQPQTTETNDVDVIIR
jgi:hypothetical protein